MAHFERNGGSLSPEYAEARQKDKTVTFTLPKKDNKLQNTFKGKTNSVTVRLVVIELENGKKEILCTSLMDAEKYTANSLKQLYQLRWGIEEAYKLFKLNDIGLYIGTKKFNNYTFPTLDAVEIQLEKSLRELRDERK